MDVKADNLRSQAEWLLDKHCRCDIAKTCLKLQLICTLFNDDNKQVTISTLKDRQNLIGDSLMVA